MPRMQEVNEPHTLESQGRRDQEEGGKERTVINPNLNINVHK